MKLVIAIALLVPALAAAQPASDTQHARQLYVTGKAHFDLAEYPAAIADWKDAYKLSKAPMLLFNIGQAYRLAGDCTQALRMYATYEREQLKPPPNLDELELAKGRCNPAPTNANPPDQPPAHAAPVPPAPINGDAINEPPAPHHREDAPNTDGVRSEWIGLGTVGVGAILLVTSYYFAHQASTDASTVSSYIGEWTTTQADVAAAGKRDATVGKLTGLAGGLAVLGGAALAFVGYRAHDRASRLAIGITPTGSEVTWRVSF